AAIAVEIDFAQVCERSCDGRLERLELRSTGFRNRQNLVRAERPIDDDWMRFVRELNAVNLMAVVEIERNSVVIGRRSARKQQRSAIAGNEDVGHAVII